MFDLKSDSLNDLNTNDDVQLTNSRSRISSPRIGVSFSSSNLSGVNKKVNSLAPSFKKNAHHHQFITVGKKSTTRHLAALDFLLNISMKNEVSIKENGIQNAIRQQELSKAEQDDVSIDSNEDKEVKENVELNINTNNQLGDDFMDHDAPGKKLSGVNASKLNLCSFLFFI
jgi:hypothetical protein